MHKGVRLDRQGLGGPGLSQESSPPLGFGCFNLCSVPVDMEGAIPIFF